MSSTFRATCAIVLLFAVQSGLGQEPEIRGPYSTPVGKSVWLEIVGVTPEQLQAGSIDVFPKGYDVDLRLLQDLRGSILIWFAANQTNALKQYDLLVIAPYLMEDKPALHRLAWTIKTGEDPDDPDPPDPPPPDQKISKAVIIWETGESTPQLNVLLQNLRDNQALSRKLLILDKDTIQEGGQRSPLIQEILALGGQPSALPVIAGLDMAGKSSIRTQLPASVVEVEQLLKKWGLVW